MKKLSLFLLIILFFLIGVYYYFLPEARWHKAVQSAGGYPYQIGLLNTQQIQCIISCNGGCCMGGQLCAQYVQVSGSMSGGMGTMALFSLMQTSMAGYKPGDSIIAGGMTMTEMDNGVLASPGGCSGCGMGKADSNLFDRIAGVVSYIIAGFKDKIK